jgi:Arginine/lysine/ornithine decarboxylases
MDKQNETKGPGLIEFIKAHQNRERASFHMPGHKGKAFFTKNGYADFTDLMIDGDLTEIEGADNLFKAEGILRETMDRYKTMYGAKQTFMLVGGSSAGIMASVVSLISRGDTLIMASNCHKSVYNALMLSEGKAIFVAPEMLDEYGIVSEISADSIAEALEKQAEAKAVIITSPNYYGVCSDIDRIAETVHAKGKILIVDEAHGAHLAFMDEYADSSFDGEKLQGGTVRSLAAENRGADIVVISTHKTLASFTQTAILLVCSDRVDVDAIANNLQILQSSSPSYILMASLDMNARIIEEHGRKLFDKWQADLDYVYEELRKINGLELLDMPLMDRTKLVFSFYNLGISGYELDGLLREKGIFCELSDSRFVMAMTGIGSERSDYEILISELRKIADEKACEDLDMCVKPKKDNKALMEELYRHEKIFDVPTESEWLKPSECEGRISVRAVIPYPPGIPIIVPGERIDARKLNVIERLLKDGISMIGLNEDDKILCGR